MALFGVFSVSFSLRRSPEDLSGIRRDGEEELRAAGLDDCVPCLVSYCGVSVCDVFLYFFVFFSMGIPARSPNPKGNSTIYWNALF